MDQPSLACRLALSTGASVETQSRNREDHKRLDVTKTAIIGTSDRVWRDGSGRITTMAKAVRS